MTTTTTAIDTMENPQSFFAGEILTMICRIKGSQNLQVGIYGVQGLIESPVDVQSARAAWVSRSVGSSLTRSLFVMSTLFVMYSHL